MASAEEPKRVPLSVLIPARNEARNLPRCLEALKDWADEIVLVDSHSTDGTAELAAACGARVLQFDYPGGWPKSGSGPWTRSPSATTGSCCWTPTRSCCRR